MRTGALKNPITIERRIKVGAKSLGEPNFVWQTFLEPFAEIVVRRGKEHFDAQTKQRYSEDVWHFRCHYDDVVGPDTQDHMDCIIECTIQDAVIGAAALMAEIADAIPDGTVGVVYDGFTVSAVGGTEPYAFSVSAGALPTGLALNASSGAVTGTPSAAATFSVTFTVTDAADDTHAMPAIEIVVAAA